MTPTPRALVHQNDPPPTLFVHSKQAYSFMLRLKMPAGVCSPELYTLLDDLSREYGHGHLRLTTRQTFQLHGVAKHNLKTVIKASWAIRGLAQPPLLRCSWGGLV